MQRHPMVLLEDSLENRVQRILRAYVVDLCAEFVDAHGEAQGTILFAERLRESLDNIGKRLGGERHQRLAAVMKAALAEQERGGGVDLHRGWIEELLTAYYDPMYRYQRKLKSSRIAFAGDRRAMIDYLRDASRNRREHD
jgi:tRNA 2-selenouridine synthase